LPDYIKFNNVYGGFYASGNDFISLEGFPNTVYDDFSLFGNSKHWKYDEIREKIEIKGTIYN
jgi:hypothetical protein